MNNKYKILNYLSIFFIISTPGAETLKLDQAKETLPIYVDVPDDWKKNIITKDNGVILNLKNGNAEMEIRNFTMTGVDMNYIINAKAARMYAKYSYINILLEKKEDQDNIKKEILFWEMRYQGKTFYEKTVIQKYQYNIVILSCTAAENEYPQNRVIFENAAASIRFDLTTATEPAQKIQDDEKKPPEKEPDQSGQTEQKEPTAQPETTGKKEIKKETLRNIDSVKKEGEDKTKADKGKSTGSNEKVKENKDTGTRTDSEVNQELFHDTEEVKGSKINKMDKLKKNQ